MSNCKNGNVHKVNLGFHRCTAISGEILTRYLDFPFSALVAPPGALSSKTIIAKFGPFSIVTPPTNISYVDKNQDHRGPPSMHLSSVTTGLDIGNVLIDEWLTSAEIDNVGDVGSSS